MAKVYPGQGLAIPANDWNNMRDAAAQAIERQLTQAAPRSQFRLPDNCVVTRLNRGVGLERFYAVELEPRIDESENADAYRSRQNIFNGNQIDQGSYGKFGVLQETIPATGFGVSQVSGATLAYVNITNQYHDHADAFVPSWNLNSSFFGCAEILYKPTGATGLTLCWIRIGAFVAPPLKAVAEEAIVVGGFGDVGIKRGGAATSVETVSAYLNWMAGTTNVSSGDELLIRFFPDEWKWVIIGAECPT